MIADTIIERVAKAIANGGDWQQDYTEEQRDVWRQKAALALRELREPTEAMLAAGWEKGLDGWGEGEECKPVWQAMIDEALDAQGL